MNLYEFEVDYENGEKLPLDIERKGKLDEAVYQAITSNTVTAYLDQSLRVFSRREDIKNLEGPEKAYELGFDKLKHGRLIREVDNHERILHRSSVKQTLSARESGEERTVLERIEEESNIELEDPVNSIIAMFNIPLEEGAAVSQREFQGKPSLLPEGVAEMHEVNYSPSGSEVFYSAGDREILEEFQDLFEQER